MQSALVSARPTRVRQGMVALVFVHVVINCLDRTNRAVARPALGTDRHLSAAQRGGIFSAFGWAWAWLPVPAGRGNSDR